MDIYSFLESTYFAKLCNLWASRLQNWYDPEDVFQMGRAHIWEKHDQYVALKGTFKTWGCTCLNHFFVDVLRKCRRKVRAKSLTIDLEDRKLDADNAFYDYVGWLDDVDRHIIENKFVDDMSLTEISKDLGTSRYFVMDRCKRVFERLKSA